MIQDIRLHGHISESLEYFAMAVGHHVGRRHFYELGSPGSDALIRFFSPYSEFTLGKQGVRYRGNGGSFCEHMFGINQPLEDFAKKDVHNRLVMYGAIHDASQDQIHFTNQTEGFESYDDIFLNGNAVSNYYFFFHFAQTTSVVAQQEFFLKRAGKILKYSEAISQENDLLILHEMLRTLKNLDTSIFLFKILHKPNKSFYETYKEFYQQSRKIKPNQYIFLKKLAQTHHISKAQQERIRVDIIYKHPDNRRLIDEYKDVLTAFTDSSEMPSRSSAQINRLRTLGVRQNIPMEIFHTLDELFLKGKNIQNTQEPKYLASTREILEGLFLTTHPTQSISISNEDLTLLLRAKLEAIEKRDFSFEGLLLEIGKSCDEYSKMSKNTKIVEQFSRIIALFDRCDTTYTTLNRIAFIDDIKINEQMILSILENKKIFDQLSPNLFREIFIDKIIKDRYLTNFGRQKISTIGQGLKEIKQGIFSMPKVIDKISSINQGARLYVSLRQSLKEHMEMTQFSFNDISQIEEVKNELISIYTAKNADNETPLPAGIFDKVVRDYHQERVYITEIIPGVRQKQDASIREKFIRQSGLDRYYLEELDSQFQN